jgi:hypothetical protein
MVKEPAEFGSSHGATSSENAKEQDAIRLLLQARGGLHSLIKMERHGQISELDMERDEGRPCVDGGVWDIPEHLASISRVCGGGGAEEGPDDVVRERSYGFPAELRDEAVDPTASSSILSPAAVL